MINDFQTYCEAVLKDKCEEHKINYDISRPEGEDYITGNVDEYEFWIYADGADFNSVWYGKVYERYDYDNLENLGQNFVQDIIWAVENKEMLKEQYRLKSRSMVQRIKDYFSKK